MLSFLDILDLGGWSGRLVFLLLAAFQIWMIVDAVRRREWVWVLILVVFSAFAAFLYYFLVYRTGPTATRGFELPGADRRHRIKELQAQIHHLDKAHHHFQLGDIYFQQGRLDKAEASYRAALERDPQDLDIRSHLGQCLLRQKRPAEARPLLEAVVAEDPKHEYGYTMMALAESLAASDDVDDAIAMWERVTDNHSYPRAKVQLAELYLKRNQSDLARAQLEEVMADDPHAPAFQRKRDRVWVGRAKRLLRQIK